MSSKRLPGRPLMVVMSSPSGGGKSTLCGRLLSEYADIDYSVSCTTRAPRGEEQDGVHYNFMSREEFDKAVRKGLFLEYAEVHGFMYGTLRSTVERALKSGRSLILDIDVQGAGQIRSGIEGRNDLVASSFVDIFVAPPSMEELRVRLIRRGEDSPESIEVRMCNAEKEMRCAGEYRYVIENDELESAYSELVGILEKESLQ